MAVGGLLLAAMVALPGCSGGPSLGRYFSDVPAGRVAPEDVEYPNINDAPDRPSKLKSPAEQAAIEASLQAEGEQHVATTEQQIQTTNRRQ